MILIEPFLSVGVHSFDGGIDIKKERTNGDGNMKQRKMNHMPRAYQGCYRN